MEFSPSTKAVMREADDAYAQDQLVKATRTYEQAIAAEPDRASAHEKLGRTYAKRGRHRQAAKSLEKALELGLDTAAIRHQLAKSYRALGELDQALIHIEKARQADPENGLHHDLAGEIRAGMKDYSAALACYALAVIKDTKLVQARVHHAFALERAGCQKEALTEVLEVFRLDPGAARKSLMNRLVEGHEGDSVWLKQFSDQLPPDAAAWLDWGKVLLRAEAWDAAREAHVRALELLATEREATGAAPPDSPIGTRHYNVEVRALAGLEKSGSVLDRRIPALIERLGYPVGFSQLAAYYHAAGEVERAVALTTRGLELLREPGAAPELLSWVGPDLASEHIIVLQRQVESLGDDNADLAWGNVLLGLERFPDAERVFQRALKRNRALPWALRQLAVSWARQYKYEEAYQALTEALQLMGDTGGEFGDLPLTELVPALVGKPARTEWLDRLIRRIDRGEVYETWVEALLELHDPDRALTQVLLALEKDHWVDDGLLDTLLTQSGKPTPRLRGAATDRLASALEERGDVERLLELAEIIKNQDRERALSYIERATRDAPADAPVWLPAARAFQALEEFGQAVACYRRYFTQGPGKDAAEGSTDWAEALMTADQKDRQTGHRALLIATIDKWARDETREDQVPLIPWEELERRRAVLTAHINELVETMCRSVDAAHSYWQVASTLYRNGELEPAIRLLRYGAELDPSDWMIRSMLGWCLLGIDRRSDAREAFRAALAQREDDASTHLGLGRAAANFNDAGEANTSFGRAVTLLAEDDKRRADAYDQWSWALESAGQLEEALAKARQARDLSDSLWTNFRLGYVQANMQNYDQAIQHYEDAADLEQHPYPLNNIAAIYQDRGRYEEARKHWDRTYDAFRKHLAQAIQARDVDYLLNHGRMAARMLGNRSVGEMLYRIGIALNPNYPPLLAQLASLYEGNQRRASTPEERSRLQLLVKAGRSKAEELLKERKDRDGDPETLIELGDLYLEMDDGDQALENFRQAQKKARPNDGRIHKGLAEVYKREKRTSLAISHLKQAIREYPDELDIKIKLGRLHLEAKEFGLAEAALRGALDVSPNEFDARVALAELYIAMGDERQGLKESEAAADHWRRAEDELQAAQAAAKAEYRSRKILPQDLAPVHYLTGYCHVSRYNATPGIKPSGLLKDARKEFAACRRLDKTHYMAERACATLREKTRTLNPDRLTQVGGPVLVVLCALVVLAGTWWFKVVGWHDAEQPAYRLADTTLTRIAAALVPEDSLRRRVVNDLDALTGKTFATRSDFLASVRELVGEESARRYGEPLARYAYQPAGVPKLTRLDDNNHLLLSLGGILFVIAGLSLPHLTSLKVGALQLDRSAISQAGDVGAAGVTVERMTTSGGPAA